MNHNDTSFVQFRWTALHFGSTPAIVDTRVFRKPTSTLGAPISMSFQEEKQTVDFTESIGSKKEIEVAILTILLHPTASRIGETFTLMINGEVELSRTSPSFGRPNETARSLDDPRISRSPVQLKISRNQISWRLPKPGYKMMIAGKPTPPQGSFKPDELRRGVVLQLGKRVLLHLQIGPVSMATRSHGALVGQSLAMETLKDELNRLLDLEVPVLLQGESGTGKELVARALHKEGTRVNKPYRALNMGAINPSTAMSELMGHRRGAFTGAANDHEGYFEQADGGTVFLDEIGLATAEVQSALLRVLETGELQRIGAVRPSKVDVRVIAATDADIEEAVEGGSFSLPLLQRLDGYRITLPPLRDRQVDIPLLFVHFLRSALHETDEEWRLSRSVDESTWFQTENMLAMLRYRWPGNVRELLNFSRQVAIFSRDKARLEIPPSFQEKLAATPIDDRIATRVRTSDLSDQDIHQAMSEHGWDLKETAAALGIARSSLYNRIGKSDVLRTAKDIDDVELRSTVEAHPGDLDAAAQSLEVSPRALRMRLQKCDWWQT
jgi:two-component system, NtrC family, nitrogen regulation response regulator GlnG